MNVIQNYINSRVSVYDLIIFFVYCFIKSNSSLSLIFGEKDFWDTLRIRPLLLQVDVHACAWACMYVCDVRST